MSMLIELAANGRKAGRVCDPGYRRGRGCPLLVRTNSEDVLVSNVFGVLKNIRPSRWLRPMLNDAFKTRRFSTCSMRGLDFSFWHPVPPPAMRAHIEGSSEVDLLIRFGEHAVFVEAKYNAKLSERTKHDAQRDQLARLLDVSWCYAVADQLFPRRPPHVLVVGVPTVEPKLVTRYRDAREVAAVLDHHQQYPGFERMCELLASRVGYISWSELASLVANQARCAYLAERPFLDDVAAYIVHKVKTAQLSAKQFLLPMVSGESCERASSDEPHGA